jgi:hypothetical protein
MAKNPCDGLDIIVPATLRPCNSRVSLPPDFHFCLHSVSPPRSTAAAGRSEVWSGRLSSSRAAVQHELQSANEPNKIIRVTAFNFWPASSEFPVGSQALPGPNALVERPAST